HHGGAWKVAYADFVTAMMAFFLVMWIVGLDQNIKGAVSAYFQDPQAFMQAVEAGSSPFSLSAMDGKKGPGKPKNEAAAEREKLKAAKKAIEKIVQSSPEFKELKDFVDIKLTDGEMRIDLMEAKESLFFDSGSARVKPEARSLLSRIASELGKLGNEVIIEGHTDIRPLARTDGYTNWELSTDRANSARQVMESAGLREKQITQVRGYAATKPRDPEHPTHFSNRRVSIVVVIEDAEEPK
ncbi:MAG: OmpA family protein, partial [Armatimonadota bacterium]